ncbi:unnamed protein product [Rhizophagus irregularis]|nr:unnamed protein product [Rhizophagus irregularis]
MGLVVMVLGTVRQFPPTTYPLKDEDMELQQCIKEIKRSTGIGIFNLFWIFSKQRNAWTTRLRTRCVHVQQNISSKTLKIQRNVHVLYVEEIICRLHLSNHHLISPLSIRRG